MPSPGRVVSGEAKADRDLARQGRDDSREQWFIERIEKDKHAGVRLLGAMIKEPGLTRLVSTSSTRLLRRDSETSCGTYAPPGSRPAPCRTWT